MPSLPRAPLTDSTLALRRDPYRFISSRCKAYGSDVFLARLLLAPTICMMGRDAARLFYDESRFQRQGAVPRHVERALFGAGGVQGLDGKAHRDRKRIFTSLATEQHRRTLGDIAAKTWETYAGKWHQRSSIELYGEARQLMTEIVCAWAGVPLAPNEVAHRARELSAQFETAASVGPAYWRGRLERRRSERWARAIVERIRRDPRSPLGGAARSIALAKDSQGALLPTRVAAVELLNLLRPSMAVSVWVTFVAHALARHSGALRALDVDDDAHAEAFVQEVRRFYPFFPAVMARVREDFEWNGFRFEAGTRTLLDLYGTNHDERIWDAPNEFRPTRFLGHEPDVFGFIPQGAADASTGHRCPGEWIAVELMKVALRFLVRRVSYVVPDQDPRIDMTRLPALPRSRMILSQVRLRVPVEVAGRDVSEPARAGA